MSTLTFDQLDDHGQSIVEAVCDRARTNAEFRARLLEDPHAAIFEATGEELPPNFSVTFFDASDTDCAIILPDPEPTGELSIDDLEMVAGGSGGGNSDDDTYGGGGG